MCGVYMCVCMYVCMYVCVCVYVCVRVCGCVCVLRHLSPSLPLSLSPSLPLSLSPSLPLSLSPSLPLSLSPSLPLSLSPSLPLSLSPSIPLSLYTSIPLFLSRHLSLSFSLSLLPFSFVRSSVRPFVRSSDFYWMIRVVLHSHQRYFFRHTHVIGITSSNVYKAVVCRGCHSFSVICMANVKTLYY